MMSLRVGNPEGAVAAASRGLALAKDASARAAALWALAAAQDASPQTHAWPYPSELLRGYALAADATLAALRDVEPELDLASPRASAPGVERGGLGGACAPPRPPRSTLTPQLGPAPSPQALCLMIAGHLGLEPSGLNADSCRVEALATASPADGLQAQLSSIEVAGQRHLWVFSSTSASRWFAGELSREAAQQTGHRHESFALQLAQASQAADGIRAGEAYALLVRITHRVGEEDASAKLVTATRRDLEWRCSPGQPPRCGARQVLERRQVIATALGQGSGHVTLLDEQRDADLRCDEGQAPD